MPLLLLLRCAINVAINIGLEPERVDKKKVLSSSPSFRFCLMKIVNLLYWVQTKQLIFLRVMKSKLTNLI